ncbi:hypothetical protein H0X06_00765 [Candidatus Dependentiae bacterium]|nr:hypothetical protein [Candidatus Dependentiae bacterium]
MRITVLLFFIIGASPLKAYEAVKYKQLLNQVIKDLNETQKLNTEKMMMLAKDHSYVLRKEQERRSPSFTKRVDPIIKGNSSVLEGLTAENRLIQEQIQQFTSKLSPAVLSSLNNEVQETHALRRAQTEASIASLQREIARAQVAQTFFENRKKQSDPAFTQGIDSFQQNWNKKRSKLTSQLLSENSVLRSLP